MPGGGGGGTNGAGGANGAAASPPPDRFTIGSVDQTGSGASSGGGSDFTSLTTKLAGFGGMLTWAIPSLVLSVPGLLLVLAMLAQIGGAAVWLPIVRRSMGMVGGRKRRQRTRPA